MKDTLRISRTLAILTATLLTAHFASANTELWIGNPGVTATTNWSDNVNWSNLTGGGGPGPNGNDVIFGDAGGVGTAGTINSVVDNSALNPFSMVFTNQSQSPNFMFTTVLIPSGFGMTNANGLTVGANSTNNGYLTIVNFVGDGTFAQNGSNLTVKSIGSTSSTGARATLDLSGLSNFVYNASGGTLNVAGSGGDARGGGTLTLAATNNITVGTISVAAGNGNGGAGGVLNLGPGPNIINAGTINICIGKVNTATVRFQGTTGSLKLRGVGGTDTDRANFLFANRNAGGTGTLNGTLDLTGHPVDIKAGTITLGQGTSNPTGTTTPQNGFANLRFDAGTVDATTINMAINSQALAVTTGNLTVGGGSLVVSNISLVNQTAGTATGNLFIGGTVNCSGNIFKTTLAGTGNITITNGTLTLASGVTVGTPAIPIDNFNLSTATLNLSVANTLANISVNALNLVDAANTANIAALPSIGGFPAQFPLVTYTSLPGGGSLNLGTLPGGYTGYVSNDTVNTLWLVITTGPVAKLDLWTGSINNLWDTTTLNWTNAGVAVNYNDADFVMFDDSAKTNNVNLTGTRLPTSLTVSNNVLNYTFSGAGSIGGPMNLIKNGSASLTLAETGGDNFSSGITVNNGTLVLDNTNSAISGGLTVASGATAQIGNDSGNGGLPAGTVAVDGTLIFKRTNDLTVGTAIFGAGSLVKSAGGKLTLTAVQTYTGNTIVNGGTLALTGTATISNSALVAVNGASLDLTSASGQTTLAALSLANANLSVAMPNVTTPVSATALNMGGAGNTINVSVLPPIATYPVTVTLIQSASPISGFNATLGTLPAATPGYAGSVALSGDQLAVRLTLTAGPVGVRPAVFWSGADVPNLNWSDGANWLLPGAPTAVDSAVFNNTATAAASALTTPGGGAAALDPANYNNIVDADFSIASLIYTNVGGTYHNTHLANGRTLSLTNTLTVGALDSGASAQQEFVTLSGSGATLSVNNTNASLQVWIGSGSVGGSQATLDLSALDNFNAIISRLTVGASAVNNAVNRPSGILYLAKTNSISVGFQTTTIETGTVTGNAGIVVGDCNGNAGSASFINLGLVNTISADTIAIARQKTTATLRFNPIYAGVAPYPSAIIQGLRSSRVSVFNVGSGVGNTGTTTGSGTADFSGGTVNLMADTMSVGRASTPASGANGGTTTGTLTFDAGNINVNTLNIGLQPAAANNLKVGIGTVNVGTNSAIGDSATLIVNGNLNLAVNAGSATTAGTLNINGGTVQASNIVAGINGAPSTINLTDGTLIVTSTAGTPAAPLTTLNLTGGKLQLNVDGTSGAPSLVATTITPSGTTTVNIGAIANVTTTSTVPLISYTGADPYSSLSRGTYPAGYAVTLVDNTGTSTIDVNIIPPTASPRIGSFTISGGNVIISGTNGTEGRDYYVLASTNIALALTNWTRLSPTNQFGPGGGFSYTNAVDPNLPQRFYLIQLP